MYILKADDQFWTGSRWSHEYPEAKLFSRFPNQREIDRAATVANENGWNGCELDAITNYGFENQETHSAIVSDEVLSS
jgi:hypothetical protein